MMTPDQSVVDLITAQAATPEGESDWTAPASNVPLELNELLARCLDNVEFAQRLLGKFADRFEGDLETLEQASRAGDSESMARVAHRMKGAAANIAAPPLQRISARLEEFGRSREGAEAAEWIERLRCEWRRFVEYRGTLPQPLAAKASSPGTDGE